VFRVDDQQNEKVDLELYDAEKVGQDDPLGVATFSLQTMLKDSTVDTWLPVAGKAKTDKGEVDATGFVHIKATLLDYSDEVPLSIDLPDKPAPAKDDENDNDSDEDSDETYGELTKKDLISSQVKRTKSQGKSKGSEVSAVVSLDTASVASTGLGGIGDVVAKTSTPRRDPQNSKEKEKEKELDETTINPQFFPCKIKIKDKRLTLGIQGYLVLCIKEKKPKRTTESTFSKIRLHDFVF